jgi:hypothetical protein
MCGHLYISRAPSLTEKCTSATSCTSTQFSARGTWVGSVHDADSERCSAGEPSAARLARLPAVRCEAGKRAAGLVDNN